MNLVVITAALSSMNAGLYTASRILYSLAREGHAPRLLAAVRPQGRVPARAVIASTLSLYAGVLLFYLAPANAFLYITSVSAFGIAFSWLMIVASHVAFRPKYLGATAGQRGGAGGPLGGARETAAQEPVLTYRAPFYPWGSLAAGLALVAVMVTMAFLPTERVGLVSGGAAVGVISLAYAAYILRRVLTPPSRAPAAGAQAGSPRQAPSAQPRLRPGHRHVHGARARERRAPVQYLPEGLDGGRPRNRGRRSDLLVLGNQCPLSRITCYCDSTDPASGGFAEGR